MPPKRAKVVKYRKKGQKKWTSTKVKGKVTNRKGHPYKKVNAKALAKTRRQFEEMKSYSHEQLAIDLGVTSMNPVVDHIYNPTVLQNMTSSTGNAMTSKIFPMWSFYNPKQGFDDESMIGSKRINKFCKCKMVFQPPAHPQVDNPKYYLISAWITLPINNTEFSTPTKAAFTRAELISHILHAVQKNFDENQKREFVNFNPIETKHYKVVSYRRIKFDQNNQSINPQMAIEPGVTVYPQTYGKASKQNHSFTWKLDATKNTQYTAGTTPTSSAAVPFLYPNKSWLPVVIYYCPDAGDPDGSAGAGSRDGNDNNPIIYYNNQTWFTG